MGEDYAMFAGLTAEEDLKEPLRESIKKRLPWLLVLLGLGMVVSSVVGIFETVVSQLTIIMAFQSLILDMAGNVGTQSLAVTIRVLMDESLTGKQKFQLVLKEMKIGFSNGMILGSISFLLVGLYIALFKGKTFLFAYAVSGCIGLSLVLAMVVSGQSVPVSRCSSKNPCRPGRCVRSADHDHQRPCGGYFLLWTELDPADQYFASGRLEQFIGQFLK